MRAASLCLALAACTAAPPAPAPPAAPRESPFRFVRDGAMGQGVAPSRQRPAGPLGLDPALPGFRSNLPIAAFRVVRTRAPLPPQFVVALVPTGPPSLEGLRVEGWRGHVATFLGAQHEEVVASGVARLVPAGTYASVAVVKGEVRVTLLGPALALLAEGGRVAWVDAYRR